MPRDTHDARITHRRCIIEEKSYCQGCLWPSDDLRACPVDSRQQGLTEINSKDPDRSEKQALCHQVTKNFKAK